MDKQEWSTRGLAQAAYLLCIGHKLLRLDGVPGSRIFVFEETETIDRDARAFFQGATYSVQLFYASLCNLKRLMHGLSA
jgi:Domain of unknown function (DUF5659)